MARSSRGLDQTVGVILSSGAEISASGECRRPEERQEPDYSIDVTPDYPNFNRTLSTLEQEVMDFLVIQESLIENPILSLKKRKQAVEQLNAKLITIGKEFGIDYS